MVLLKCFICIYQLALNVVGDKFSRPLKGSLLCSTMVTKANVVLLYSLQYANAVLQVSETPNELQVADGKIDRNVNLPHHMQLS